MTNAAIGNQILKYMAAQKYRIRALNIVYIEGVDPDTFAVNSDRLNDWNDVRMIIRESDGNMLLCASATTEPGSYYTYSPMNPGGAARIAFGQYLDAWQVGIHGAAFPHEALIQCGSIKVHRDFNQDGLRVGDAIDVGSDFGVNQHSTSNAPDSIGPWSAGCLVGRYLSSHQLFMSTCKGMGHETFDTTVLDGSEMKRLRVI
jgi:hypothetical protein